MTYLDLLRVLESSINNNEYKDEEVKNKYSNYLTFSLNNEVYAISVERMEKVIPLDHMINSHEGPEYKKGLMRDENGMIEIIDLRLRLNIDPKNYDSNSTVIVAKKNKKLIGLIVDDVIDFADFTKANHSSVNKSDYFIQGIIEDHETSIKILNVDNVLNFN
jgi:purine-binding chemotaxis protein CheW